MDKKIQQKRKINWYNSSFFQKTRSFKYFLYFHYLFDSQFWCYVGVMVNGIWPLPPRQSGWQTSEDRGWPVWIDWWMIWLSVFSLSVEPNPREIFSCPTYLEHTPTITLDLRVWSYHNHMYNKIHCSNSCIRISRRRKVIKIPSIT